MTGTGRRLCTFGRIETTWSIITTDSPVSRDCQFAADIHANSARLSARTAGSDLRVNGTLMDTELRERIIADPAVVLDDVDIMRALVAAYDRTMGNNVVDLRGIAMERLEARLDRLAETHRAVIAAAYENLAGTNQIHRAVLRLLEPVKFETFLRDLGGDIAEILRVEAVRLVIEANSPADDSTVKRVDGVLSVEAQGFVESYITRGRAHGSRQVTLRQIRPEFGRVYGDKADFIRSEACLRLDFGPGRLPGMLALGSEDPHQFTPQQGTELLAFFAGAVERAMRRWLA